jgi:hypothetical protein
MGKRSKGGLIYDMGATHHVVCDPALLHDPVSRTVDRVTLGSGEEHRVTCQGTVVDWRACGYSTPGRCFVRAFNEYQRVLWEPGGKAWGQSDSSGE